MSTFDLLTVVREPRFESECETVQPDVRRMDDALRYVEERLARSPASGIQTDVPGIWVAPIRVPKGHDGGIVRASIFYTFDTTYVRLQSLRLAL